MHILHDPITRKDLAAIAQATFGDLVKGVVDVQRDRIAIDAELHADLEALLLEEGSQQEHLWGVNFYPDLAGEDFVEFDSMINLRPSHGNMSRGIDSEEMQKKVLDVIHRWIEP